MQTWLSFHIHPHETLDVFLARGVRPFLVQHIWPVQQARAFFIRYEDENGPHIRLRLRGDEALLRPALQSWFEDRGSVEEFPYQAEAERFGGEEALKWAEEYFHLSTRVVLDRLNRPYTYGDAMFDALRMHVITAFSAGWNREKSSWYFENLCRQWIDLFFQATSEASNGETNWQDSLLQDFEESFAPQREELRLAVVELWTALEKGKFDEEQPEWLRWLRGNQLLVPEFGNEALEKSLPSLLHLTNNRLGINNQDEVYLNFLLWKTL